MLGAYQIFHMKIVFVENRYKTIFWSALAENFRSVGHTVVWIVQNPIFTPGPKFRDGLLRIPFPRKKDLAIPRIDRSLELKNLRRIDRNVNYFGGSDTHYEYYKNKIASYIDLEKPDFVVGESTLFHEIITINICKEIGIPYLNPSMPGYPGGRFSVYPYDKKEPILLDSIEPNDDFCKQIIDSIIDNKRVPQYMIPPDGRERDRTYPLPGSLFDRVTILRGYMLGERYNTPSPWRKWLLDRKTKGNIKRWDELSQKKPPTSQHERQCWALYPLQVQPEANIDVWGEKYRDQAELVKSIANSLPDNWGLLVKLNPKTKYELSNELLSVVSLHSKIYPLQSSKKMSSIFDWVDLVCTVTGTVSIEAFLHQKPLVILGPSVLDSGPGCIKLDCPNQVGKVARDVQDGNYVTANHEDQIRLIKKIYRSTIPGTVSDPLYSPSVLSVENVTAVSNGIMKAVRKVDN